MQADEGESLETQQTRIGDYCRFKMLNLIKIYEDKGVSGKNVERKGFQELLSSLCKGETVIVNDLSRLSRNTKDALCMFEEF